MKNYFLASPRILIIVVLNFFLIQSSWSATTLDSVFNLLAASHEDFHYANYYTIKDDPRAAFVDLLNFENVHQEFPYPEIPYNRKNHFGSWISIPLEQLCQNTRSKVLARDSAVPVTFSPNGCIVKTGQWKDPYSDTAFESSAAIQIDHLVPLKNAYMTGAHAWESNKRCLYANYLHNNFHLISVSGTENLKKSDNNPAVYLPPNKKYVCEYMKHWLQVKVIWQLKLTPIETEGILTQVAAEHCDHADFKMLTSQLEVERNYIDQHADYCRHPEATTDLAADF